MKAKKLKIGITGSIGSGKSVFADYIAGKGYPLLKADDISKEILASDPAVKKKIIKEFGDSSFKGDSPDKKYLAQHVFSSPENVVVINSILHPPVLKKIEKEMEAAIKSSDAVFVEAALIYEADMEGMFDYVVLVTADEAVRRHRKTVIDQIHEEDFVKRDMNQIADEEKKKRADFIFENNGTLRDLYDKADLLIMMMRNL